MIYSVTVKPGSKKGDLVLKDNDSLTVFLKARPIEGKANLALVKILAEHFKVPKSQVLIKSGAHRRKKLVEIKTVV